MLPSNSAPRPETQYHLSFIRPTLSEILIEDPFSAAVAWKKSGDEYSKKASIQNLLLVPVLGQPTRGSAIYGQTRRGLGATHNTDLRSREQMLTWKGTDHQEKPVPASDNVELTAELSPGNLSIALASIGGGFPDDRAAFAKLSARASRIMEEEGTSRNETRTPLSMDESTSLKRKSSAEALRDSCHAALLMFRESENLAPVKLHLERQE
ncbi:hypothetical protein F5148DRAFT_1366826 [Russula earlei]|uniref:Uncharacterized protein n=1 Tax=Russula earlei TaxID=71964 RepID=A0ACC0UF96_9AGAM|nr:hypothetical protein F5148DRAFT_1366826 [Russula earlei]